MQNSRLILNNDNFDLVYICTFLFISICFFFSQCKQASMEVPFLSIFQFFF